MGGLLNKGAQGKFEEHGYCGDGFMTTLIKEMFAKLSEFCCTQINPLLKKEKEKEILPFGSTALVLPTILYCL